MDDFGSGYSNLWRLRNLPFHSVKFDRRLLADLDTDPLQQSQFLEALLAVARSLRLRTVLEGLETQDQVDLACKLGADAGQGFALSLPLLPEQVPSWAAHFEWRRTVHAESR
jgi:EAL domain-containing protein (putative c-di-GMP-specific phosphodiesterase class I)